MDAVARRPHAAPPLETVVQLALVDGIGPARLSMLLARFGTPERVLAAQADELMAVPGFGRELVKRIREGAGDAGRQRARAALATLREIGAVAITPADAAYPSAFRTLPDPPFLLFAMGNLELLAAPGIGVVGTRSPTDYGRRATAALAGDLARAGYSIISGMARGIDAAAHAAALEAGGGTVGVLGHGIDVVYPPENRRLFEVVGQRGLLLTEMPPGEEPLAGNFPRRNRLIAALSQGVLVVEMGEKSGAQHTVAYALEQGKEVFSVPGQIGSPQSAGTNQLLKDGARLVTSANDILEELRGVGHAAVPATPVAAPAPRPAPAGLAPDEAAVLAALAADPRHVDEIAADSGLAPGAVLTALLGLELRDLAESLPGKQYRRR